MMTQPAQAKTRENPRHPYEAVRLSIGFLMDKLDRLAWRRGGGTGPWEACLCSFILAKTPHCKTRRLLEALPADNARMDKVSMLNTMANLGYFSRSAEMKAGEIDARLLPCLFVPDGGEDAPWVLLSRTDTGFTVYDSLRHEICDMPHGQDACRTNGKAYFFEPFDPARQKISKFLRGGTGNSWFSALVQRLSRAFWQILLTSIALNAFALASPLFIMAVYDRVISPANIAALPMLTIGVFLIIAAEYALRAARSRGLSWMTARIDNLVGKKIFAHLIGLPPALIEQASVAAQVARIKTFESVRDFFSGSVFLSFIEVPFVIFALVFIGAVAGPLVAVPLAMLAGYAVLFAVMRRKIKSAIRLAAKASSARQQFTMETFEKLHNIRANGLGDAWRRKFSDLSGRENVLSFQLNWLGSVAETLAHALTLMAAVLTLSFGVHFIWAGTMTTGALVATMILVWRVLLPFYSLCTMIPRLEQLRNSIVQINDLMDLETEAEAAGAVGVLPSLRGAVHFDSVSLRYEEGGEMAVNGLSFSAAPGGIVALTGRNGCGKTTVLKLIKGLYRPQTGTVRVDGFDLRQMDAAEFRRQTGYVPQAPDFFPGTISENILIGNPMATREEVENALHMADAWDDVSALPQGMDSDIAAVRLSMGFAARLSLARAYLQDAPVLLIDELPNAVLNSRAGDNLKEYLKQSKDKRTVILVTHRGDFMRTADLILHLDKTGLPHAEWRAGSSEAPRRKEGAQ